MAEQDELHKLEESVLRQRSLLVGIILSPPTLPPPPSSLSFSRNGLIPIKPQTFFSRNYSYVFCSVLLSSSVSSLCLLPVLSCVLTKLGIVSMLVCAGACLCAFVCVYALRIVSTDKILRFSDTSIYYYLNVRFTDLFDTCSFSLYTRVVLITFKLRGSGQHSKTELLPNENQVRHNFALSSASTFRE